MLATTVACHCFAQSKPQEESFYSQAQHAILRLEYAGQPNLAGQTVATFGTGFLVHTETNNWYVITAAHVATEPFSYTAKVPLSLDNGDTVDARMVLPHDKWEFPTDVGDREHFGTDVAAMKIRVYGGGLRSFVYCPRKCAANETNQLDSDPEPPDVVVTFGFPLVTGMTVFARPLGRQGMVAFVDTKTDTISVENKWFDRRGFVIDIPTIAGGASGSR